MGAVRIQSLPKIGWLVGYVFREKRFNDVALPRVLEAMGFRTPVATAARSFARDRRLFQVDPARHEGKGLVFAWGDHEINPDDPEDVARAMRVVKRVVEKRFFMAASVAGAQADGKGRKFHIHLPMSNVVLEDCEVDGQRFRAGAALGGTITDIEGIRHDFDEACREEGVLQTNLPYAKGDRRWPSDRVARREGKKSQSDFCKDEIDEVIALGFGPDLDVFKYELAARGVELRVTPKVSGKYAGQTWLAYRREGTKGWTLDTHMGLERYGYDAVMRDLAEPRRRKPRTANPVGHDPKPLPDLTDAERIESARVVEELAAGMRADRAAKQREVADRDARHEAETAQQTQDDALGAYVARVDPQLWADDDVSWSEYEERYLAAMLAEQTQLQDEPSLSSNEPAEPTPAPYAGTASGFEEATDASPATTPVPQAVEIVQIVDDAEEGEDVPQLTEQEREEAETELLALRFRTITEGASWSDEEYAAKLVRAEELREVLGIGPDEEPPTPDEVIAAWTATFGDGDVVAAGHIETADFGAGMADLEAENEPLANLSPESARQRARSGSILGSAPEGTEGETLRNEETGSRAAQLGTSTAPVAHFEPAGGQKVGARGPQVGASGSPVGNSRDGAGEIHTDPGRLYPALADANTPSADAPALAESEKPVPTTVTPAVDLSRSTVSSPGPDYTPADAPALAGSGGSGAVAPPPKPIRSKFRDKVARNAEEREKLDHWADGDEYCANRLRAGLRLEETEVKEYAFGSSFLRRHGHDLHPATHEQMTLRAAKFAAKDEEHKTWVDKDKAIKEGRAAAAKRHDFNWQYSDEFNDLVADRKRADRQKGELEEQIAAGVYEKFEGRWNKALPPRLVVALEMFEEEQPDPDPDSQPGS